jgi:hypothetical protein
METEQLCKPARGLDIIRPVKARRIAVCVALLTTLLFSEKHFTPPPAAHAATYPAHESHEGEKVSIAIDPLDTPEKDAIFKGKYREIGFLPIRVIISNDSDKTLMLQDLKIQYITVRRDKLEPATNQDIYRRLVRPNRADKSHPGMHLPFPVGKKGEPINKDVQEEYESAQFLTVPVTAHATHSGYLFFDVTNIDSPEAGAHLYLSGLKADGRELFYFDIPLEKYLNSRPVK